MDHWKTLIQSIFGKRAMHKWFLAAVDFQLVDKSIKSACVFDRWAVTAEDVQRFLLMAHEQGIILNCLQVLSIELDVVICNPSSFGDNSFHNLADSKFIDVTASLTMPVISDSDKILLTSTCFTDVRCWLRENSMAKENTPITVHNVKLCQDVNVPCLFGLLLSYPCVYWYDTTASGENCLSSQQLHLFQVKGNILWEAMSSTDKQLSRKPHVHVIFSFTVPENLSDETQRHVAEWFARWKDSILWYTMFASVWLEEKLLNPQAVCL